MTVEKQQPRLITLLRDKWAFWLLLSAITLFAAWVRLYELGRYPQIFSQDEQVLGYDGLSLWQTGRDHHGQLLPIYFLTFNDYVPPVSNYIEAPFVGLLGLDETTTRLPIALMGIGTVWLVGLLGRRWFGPAAGLLAALFLSIDPWHVNYSRIAFPTGGVVVFTTAGLYAFTRATDALKAANRPTRVVIGWLALSAISFALLTGEYSTMRIQAPLLVGACVLAAAPLLWRHRRLTFAWLVMYAVLISPLVIALLINWKAIQTRFNTISALNHQDWVVQSLRLYADHYNPGALLFSGYGGQDESVRRPLYIGELFWLEVPLWTAAFIGLSKRRTSRRVAFSLAVLCTVWFLTFPVADSLTEGAPPIDKYGTGGPHELRSYNFLPLPELLAGFGVVVVYHALKRYRRGKFIFAALVGVGAIVLVIFVIVSLSYFFDLPIEQSDVDPHGMPWNIGLRAVMDQLIAQVQPCDVVWFPQNEQTYMYYLFYARIPPAQAQQYDLTKNDGRWLDIREFGQVKIGDPNPVNPGGSALPECAGKPQRVFNVTRSAEKWPGWKEITATRNKIGAPLWRLLVKPLRFFTDGRINDADVNATMTGYCLPDEGIRIEAIDNGAHHPLYAVSRADIDAALKRAASEGNNIQVGDKDIEGRQLWALTSGELEFHDARGILYDYIFDARTCTK